MRILVRRIGGLLFLLVLAVFSGTCRSRQQGPPQPEDPLAELARHRARANTGDADAEYRVAVVYSDGRIVARDDREAARYLHRAAERGHAGAQYRLAVMYDTGRGVPRDFAEAYRWYRQAAERGDPRAQHKLGLIYDKERGTARDATEALKWYRLAAERGHAGAAGAILALRKPQPEVTARDAARATFAIARPRQPVISTLDRLERTAAAAHAALVGTVASRTDLDALWKKYAAAEQEVTNAVDAAWREVPFTHNLPVLISDPLTLAMLDLQIEVRRRSGASEHTEVPALMKDPGCGGDLIQDRLVYWYGSAAANPREQASEAITKALDDIARQIACLSVRQLAEFEAAVSAGFVATAVRMKKNGLASVLPAFARLVAPVQLLILDARKHRGERAPSWHWFRVMGPTLKQAVAASGWASNGMVYLWDRRGAFLIGFPPCAPGAPTPNCVDLRRLLESLADPRAIGLGDCALAGMIVQGPDRIGGQDRYTCPATPCTPDPDPQRDRQAIEQLRQDAVQTWPSTPPQDIVPDRQQVPTRTCRANGLTLQTGLDVVEECLAEIFNQAPNPWDTYAACTAEAIGAGDEPPPIGASLPGVPMGRGCGPFDEAGGSEPGVLEEIWDAVVDYFSGEDDAAAPPEPETARVTVNPDATVDVQLPSGGKMRVNANGTLTFELNTKQDIDEAADLVLRGYTGRLKTEDGRIDIRINEARAFDALEKLHQAKGQLRDCADPTSCSGACTGMGAQIAAVNQCTDDLLDAFNEALGRRPREPEPQGRPRGIVSIWDPESAPVDEGQETACEIPSGNAPAKQANECGLVHCPDAAGGLALAAVGGRCCGAVEPRAVLQPRGCYEVNCGPDQILGDDCRCVPLGGEPPPDRPPLPTGGRGPGSPR
jgi:TPR repeat protein